MDLQVNLKSIYPWTLKKTESRRFKGWNTSSDGFGGQAASIAPKGKAGEKKAWKIMALSKGIKGSKSVTSVSKRVIKNLEGSKLDLEAALMDYSKSRSMSKSSMKFNFVVNPWWEHN